MKRDGHLRAEELRIGHILQQSVSCRHVSSAFVHGLAEIIDEILVHILLDNDQALHAEGLGVIVDAGVGACRDSSLDVCCVVCKDLVQLFVGHIQNVDILGGSQVQLSADRKACETECRIQDAVADCVSAVAEAQVLKARVVLVDAHDVECCQGSVLRCGGSRSDGDSLALQLIDVLQSAGLQGDAAENRGVDRADDADVVELSDVSELSGSVVAVQDDVCGRDCDVDFTGSNVLDVLEGSGRGLGVALHAFDVVGPALGNSCACRIHGSAGVCGSEGHDDVAAGLLLSLGLLRSLGCSCRRSSRCRSCGGLGRLGTAAACSEGTDHACCKNH